MNLSQRDQALLAVLIVILIGFLFFRFIYLPLNREIQAETAGKQQLLLEKERLQAQVKKAPVHKEKTEDVLARLNRRLPVNDEMIPLLSMLDESTAKYKLPLSSLDYKGAKKAGEGGAEILVLNISTKGKIIHLFKFLEELENAERLISVEDVSFNAVKAEAQDTAAEDKGPPAYYIAPPEIPEAKLQRIKFEVQEEKESENDSERLVADSFMPDIFEMKITIKVYYAAPDKAAQSKANDTKNKARNDAQNTKGEV